MGDRAMLVCAEPWGFREREPFSAIRGESQGNEDKLIANLNHEELTLPAVCHFPGEIKLISQPTPGTLGTSGCRVANQQASRGNQERSMDLKSDRFGFESPTQALHAGTLSKRLLGALVSLSVK